MLLKYVDKVHWKDNVWEKVFNFINELKNEYSLTVRSMNHVGDGGLRC